MNGVKVAPLQGKYVPIPLAVQVLDDHFIRDDSENYGLRPAASVRIEDQKVSALNRVIDLREGGNVRLYAGIRVGVPFPTLVALLGRCPVFRATSAPASIALDPCG